jgi:hypothetical protein
MRGLKFRWILPFLLTLANLSLFAISMSHGPGTRTFLRQSASADFRNVVLQDDETFTFKPLEPPEASWELKTAIVLNLPAVFLGIIVAAILQRTGDSAVIGFASCFVPILWNRIGLWIDRQFGLAAPRKRLLLSSVLRFLFRLLAGFLLIAMVLSLTFEGHRLGHERMFISCVLILWSGVYLACSFRGTQGSR